MELHAEILSGAQKQVLGKLGILKERNFYLEGGTALALQLGHRTSLDFDFYSREKFDNDSLANDLKKLFPDSVIELPDRQPEDTFQGEIDGVQLSAFHYPYELINSLIDFPPIKLAGIEDIAAMKVAAIIQRGKQRDFVDIYYLIEKLGMARVIEVSFKKYPWYQENSQIIFKTLTYFDEADADTEVSRISLLDKNLSWEQVKQKIATAVKSQYLHYDVKESAN